MEKGLLLDKDREPFIGGLDFYVAAFYELSTCRQLGRGVGPIPFTDIVEYSRLIDVGDFEDFHHIIRMLDAAYMAHQASKAKGSDASQHAAKKD